VKIIAPDYYPQFRCIADACRHSCCAGWEIDIDPDTLALYRGVGGELGERLRAGIAEEDGCASFRLDAAERCPFLNSRGLCDIILALGEGALSQICRDHPRFRSFFSDREEIGLGMCCEAAAELILSRKEPVRLITLEDDGETEMLTAEEEQLLARRDALIALAQDRTLSFERRSEGILRDAGAVMPALSFAQWIDVYLSLEQMDPAWGELLRCAAGAAAGCEVLSDREAEQIAVYFLYRHLPAAEDESDFAARAAFAMLSVRMIGALRCRLPAQSTAELCRLYSSEIEYSEENTAALAELCRRPAGESVDNR